LSVHQTDFQPFFLGILESVFGGIGKEVGDAFL
jgi:hypothetical protein